MIKVGVIRGGISPEYDVSLDTGQAVLSALREALADKYSAIDILIDKEGLFHLNGLPTTAEKLRLNVDVVWNALHGFYGEDGKMSQLLESLGIPYTGSGPLASALSMHKIRAKQAIQHLGIRMPSHFMLARYDEAFDGSPDSYAVTKAQEIYEKMAPPWIVKPVSGGSSVSAYLAKTKYELAVILRDMTSIDDEILVEEYITGKEASVGVLEQFRGNRQYTFLPIEIVKPSGTMFDYDAKYGDGEAQEISPGRFTREETQALQEAARAIHNALDLRHYSRSDFIVHPKRGIYFLEVNSLPGLTEESLLPKMIESIGSSFPEFVDHVIGLAMKGK